MNLLLAGCNGQSSNPEGVSSTQSAVSSAELTVETTDVSDGGSKEIITINTGIVTGAAEAWQAVGDAYTALHPNVKIVVEKKPSDGYAEWLINTLSTDNASADIVNINQAGAASKGKCINFMEYINNISPYSNGPWKDQFNFEV